MGRLFCDHRNLNDATRRKFLFAVVNAPLFAGLSYVVSLFFGLEPLAKHKGTPFFHGNLRVGF